MKINVEYVEPTETTIRMVDGYKADAKNGTLQDALVNYGGRQMPF